MQKLVVNQGEAEAWGAIRRGNQNGFFLEMDEMVLGQGYMARIGGEVILLAKGQDDDINFFRVEGAPERQGQITQLGLHLQALAGDA